MSQLIKPGTHPTITELFIKRIPVFECEAVIDYVVRFLILKISKKHHLGPFELNIMRNPRTKSTANPKDDVDTTGWVVFMLGIFIQRCIQFTNEVLFLIFH